MRDFFAEYSAVFGGEPLESEANKSSNVEGGLVRWRDERSD